MRERRRPESAGGRAGCRDGGDAPRPAARRGQLLLRRLPVRGGGDPRRGHLLRKRRGGVRAGAGRGEHPAAAGDRWVGVGGAGPAAGEGGREGGRLVVGALGQSDVGGRAGAVAARF